MTEIPKRIRIYVAKSRFLWCATVFIPRYEYEPMYADNKPYIKPQPDIAIGYAAFTKKRLLKKINKRIEKEITK